MKKLSVLFCYIFALIFCFGAFSSTSVYAETDGVSYIEIDSIEDLQNIEMDNNYILTEDIDASAVSSFDPILSFNGILNGNGHTIKNLTIQGTSGVALFLNTYGATIKNLQMQNVKITANQNLDGEVVKCAILVANSTNTTIENVSFISGETQDSNNIVDINAKTSIYSGLIVADSKGGTKILNCYVEGDININGNDNFKSYYIGGLIGNLENSQIYNTISNININASNLNQNNINNNLFIGGMVGLAKGTQTSLLNNVMVGEISIDSLNVENFVASFVGFLYFPNDMPSNFLLNYFYTTLDEKFIGNYNQLKNSFLNQETSFNVDLITMQNVSYDVLLLKDSYLISLNFDSKKMWDFNSIWKIDERVSLPNLQMFSSFSYTLNEDLSFTSLTKPEIDEPIINFVKPNSYNYSYGEQIVVAGNITTSYDINKFYSVSGLRKNNSTLFLNQDVLDVINNEFVTKVELDENTNQYTLGSEIVVEKKINFSGYDFNIYNLNNGSIYWGTYKTQQKEDVHVYFIENCNISNQGEYGFLLQQIKYTLTVSTENVDYGTIRRSTADSSVKNEIIEDVVVYGQNISYIATPTEDFAFNSWKINEEQETFLTNLSTISAVFDEKAFMEGGIFENFVLGEDDLTLYATFTRNVCEITIKFAINDEIVDENLSKVYFDGIELATTNDVYFKKVKMGTDHTVKINIPAEYEITNWYLSDGTNNLGVIALEQDEIELSTTEEDEEIILVVNLFKEVDDITNNSALWWIIGGSVGGILVIGLVIFLIIKKKKDNSYKNYYY